MKIYTKRHNLNRGYMKLEVWNNGMDLFKYCCQLTNKIQNLDFKLKTQILDSAQSISSNIAEGYCRRSLNEYLHFLSISLGSSDEKEFELFDIKHYEVENKLLALIKSLQLKQQSNSWDQKVHEPDFDYIP